MTPSWRVTPEATEEQVLPTLERDRIWNCFAIADLDPPFKEVTRIGLAEHEDGAVASLMVLDRPDLRVVSPFGSPEGVRVLLRAARLPASAFLQARADHQGTLEECFDLENGWECLLRMSVSPAAFQRPVVDLGEDFALEPLDPSHSAELSVFYGPMARGPFPDEQLIHGVLWGARIGGRLVGAAGTHVVSRSRRIAVVGGVFTHPDYRRRGLAAALTARVTQDLFDRGCHDVALNVVAANQGAIRVYERLGYSRYCRFLTGIGQHSRGIGTQPDSLGSAAGRR